MTARAMGIWLIVGGIGWSALIWLGAHLYATTPPSAGFDLELILEAGRRVAHGVSPYDADMVTGSAPAAPELFYSYPPPVAQAMSLVGSVPSIVMLVIWDTAAIVGLLLVADRLRVAVRPDVPRMAVLLPLVASVPFVVPLAVGLLFGNLDVFFPLLYGSMLLAVVVPTKQRALAGGLGLGLASLKLHSASMGLWFAIRAVVAPSRAWSPSLVLVAAALLVLVVVAGSVVTWSAAAWLDYAAVVRTGMASDVVDPRNAGPAAQLALALRAGSQVARPAHVAVLLVAIAVTVIAATRLSDATESMAWAAAGSLATLPVTWIHYPVAMLPFAINAILRAKAGSTRRAVSFLLVGAMAASLLSMSAVPALWVAVALVLVAVRSSRPSLAQE